MKFACLYTLNRLEKVGEVSEQDIDKAIKLCEWLLECSYKDTSTRFLVDKGTKIRLRILSCVSKAGRNGITERVLYRSIGTSKKYIEEHLQTLIMAGEIELRNIINKKTKRENKCYFKSVDN